MYYSYQFEWYVYIIWLVLHLLVSDKKVRCYFCKNIIFQYYEQHKPNSIHHLYDEVE